MIDKNLFPYDLAITAIFKDEGKYLKEWLDYHLLAGVDHFFLYNNDSSDDYKEVLAPYIEKNLVTLKDFPGKLMMYPAYNDAIENYRFECRYMAFIDIDEFIFPKTNQSISEVVDDILFLVPSAAGFGINWQIFGSNGQEKADYSRGVLERFTQRAPNNWSTYTGKGGNIYKKVIENPRFVRYRINPHFSFYFDGKIAINSDGKEIPNWYGNFPVLFDKIVLNHYYTKSKEEFENKKMPKGSCCVDDGYVMENFHRHDRNEEFDDEILKYRAARAEIFSLENYEEKLSRAEKTVIDTLTQRSPFDAPEEFFIDKMETFLACRALAEKFNIKIDNLSVEEYALLWIYQALKKISQLTRAELQLFISELPKILTRPFPIVKKIKMLTQEFAIPIFCEALKNGDVFKGGNDWKASSDLMYIQKLLRLIN